MATEVEEKIKRKDIIGAFDVLKYWYRKFSGRTLKPSHFGIDKTRETYVRLFTVFFVNNPLLRSNMMRNQLTILSRKRRRLGRPYSK